MASAPDFWKVQPIFSNFSGHYSTTNRRALIIGSLFRKRLLYKEVCSFIKTVGNRRDSIQADHSTRNREWFLRGTHASLLIIFHNRKTVWWPYPAYVGGSLTSLDTLIDRNHGKSAIYRFIYFRVPDVGRYLPVSRSERSSADVESPNMSCRLRGSRLPSTSSVPAAISVDVSYHNWKTTKQIVKKC